MNTQLNTRSKISVKSGLIAGVLLALALPMTATAGNHDPLLGVKASVNVNTEANLEQVENGIPAAVEIRARAQMAVKEELDENRRLELEDPKTGKTLMLKYKGSEKDVLRLDGDFATEILDEAGYGVVAKGKLMAFAPVSDNIYVGRSNFVDMKSGAEVEVDTWMDYDEGELESVMQVISRVDGESRISYEGHATSELSTID